MRRGSLGTTAPDFQLTSQALRTASGYRFQGSDSPKESCRHFGFEGFEKGVCFHDADIAPGHVRRCDHLGIETGEETHLRFRG